MIENFYLQPDGENEEKKEEPKNGDVGGTAPDEPDTEV